MKIDNIYVLYENNNQYFESYDKAYYNSKLCSCKKVNYVFTPTMQLCRNVGDLERVSREFFRKTFDCDYYDILKHERVSQLKLIGDI